MENNNSPDDADHYAVASRCPRLCSSFNLHGWRPDPSLTDDENYMDMVLLITRSSTCKTSGRVGCVLVDTAIISSTSNGENETVEELEMRLFGCIIGAATNSPLFAPTDSDIHAEISCLGQACNSNHAVRGCTAYITIAPCKRCFAALVAFRIGRIVSRQLPPQLISDCAARNGIQVDELTREMNRKQMARINGLINTGRSDEELMEYVQRRKKWREQRKREKKEKAGEMGTS
mmetsp:Transcript_24722/g.50726  ORF Transcript_24722/g.50726 Transcript_24722/m.50726 type:complete len:233 (-) Transcript_24722:1923-2621(-)